MVTNSNNNNNNFYTSVTDAQVRLTAFGLLCGFNFFVLPSPRPPKMTPPLQNPKYATVQHGTI
jgi:hypothetical protein